MLRIIEYTVQYSSHYDWFAFSLKTKPANYILFHTIRRRKNTQPNQTSNLTIKSSLLKADVYFYTSSQRVSDAN